MEKTLRETAVPSLILIGASAGGLKAVRELVACLPFPLGAALAVVVHTHSSSPRMMAHLLESAGPRRACYPEDYQIIEEDWIYVAPPGRHMLVEDRVLRLSAGPKMNLHRPAIDALFYSAALHHGRKVTAAVLTGYLHDGTWGAKAVKDCGGCVLVQDPEEAQVPDMPRSVLHWVQVDFCGPIPALAERIAQQVKAKSDSLRAGTAHGLTHMLHMAARSVEDCLDMAVSREAGSDARSKMRSITLLKQAKKIVALSLQIRKGLGSRPRSMESPKLAVAEYSGQGQERCAEE